MSCIGLAGVHADVGPMDIRSMLAAHLSDENRLGKPHILF